MTTVYLIGSLRNPQVTVIANQLRAHGYDVFDDWMAAGPEADDKWRDYEIQRGHGVRDALLGYAAEHVFQFDLQHLRRANIVVMLMPAGKSGHLELGWALGQGKPGYILFDQEPERFDVMWKFATAICYNVEELLTHLSKGYR